MKKYLKVCLVVLLSSCKNGDFGTIPQTTPSDRNVFNFLEGKISSVEGWKISHTNIIQITDVSSIYLEYVEKIDTFTFIYKNDDDEYFKIIVDYYGGHWEYLFVISEAMDSLESAKNVVDMDGKIFLRDKFLENIEECVSFDGLTISNGNIYGEEIMYFEYIQNINSTTAIYKDNSSNRYAKYTLKTDEEFLFSHTSYYKSIEDAKKDTEIVGDVFLFYE